MILYLKLFFAYLKIGFFGFGGGVAMFALSYSEVVARHHWLTESEMTDLWAISQMTPGPMVINSATHIGYAVAARHMDSAIAGNIGALLAVLAVSLPSLTVMLILTRFYLHLSGNKYVSGAMKGMQPMIIAMICIAALKLANPATFVDWKSWALFGACFMATVLKANPIWIVVASGALGVILYY